MCTSSTILNSVHYLFDFFSNCYFPHFFSQFHPPSALFFFPPYVQKPHGVSASNLNMLGSPFVLLVQRPHNAASIAQDPLSADLIR